MGKGLFPCIGVTDAAQISVILKGEATHFASESLSRKTLKSLECDISLSEAAAWLHVSISRTGIKAKQNICADNPLQYSGIHSCTLSD